MKRRYKISSSFLISISEFSDSIDNEKTESMPNLIMENRNMYDVQCSQTGPKHKHFSVGSADLFFLNCEVKFFGPFHDCDINYKNFWPWNFLLKDDPLTCRIESVSQAPEVKYLDWLDVY